MLKCDVPLRHRGALRQHWRIGILGCLDAIHGTTMEEFDDDYAVRTCEKIIYMLEIFCTPLGETSKNEQVFERFRTATRSIVVDGALQKVAHVLKLRFLTNVVLICRDPAHMVRIACSQPLERTGRFQRQHEKLFSGKHALIKDIQHSDIFQARLEACQKIVVQTRGSQGGVQHILRHFSFAPHRWESFAAPRRQYACLLNAVWLFLADIVNDPRQEPQKRKRAEECMDEMTPRYIFENGVAGDYTEVCMRFTWAFDTGV